MADNYTEFSEQIEQVTPEEQAWLEHILVCPDDFEDDAEFESWVKKFFDCDIENAPVDFACWPGFCSEFEEQGDQVNLWVHSDGDGNADNAILLFDLFLAGFRPTQEYVFSWANTCSRPIIGAYGGGSYICNKQPATRIAEAKAAIAALQPGELPFHSPRFSDREVATILAGLRLRQQQVEAVDDDPYAIDEIASECGMFDPLNEDEIDALIERINFGEASSRHPILEHPISFWVGDTDTFGCGTNPFAAWAHYLKALGVDIDLSKVEMSVTQGDMSQMFCMENIDDALAVLDAPHPTPRRFILTARADDIITNFDVVHTLASEDAAVNAIKAGITAWLETADIPEKETDNDCPFPMFTWSHYADYCQEIAIPGIVSVTRLNAHYTVDLDEDFLPGEEEEGEPFIARTTFQVHQMANRRGSALSESEAEQMLELADGAVSEEGYEEIAENECLGRELKEYEIRALQRDKTLIITDGDD